MTKFPHFPTPLLNRERRFQFLQMPRAERILARQLFFSFCCPLLSRLKWKPVIDPGFPCCHPPPPASPVPPFGEASAWPGMQEELVLHTHGKHDSFSQQAAQLINRRSVHRSRPASLKMPVQPSQQGRRIFRKHWQLFT